MNQFDLAQHDAQAAQRLHPSLPGLHTISGMILEQNGDYPAAEAALKEALAMDPNDFNAQLHLKRATQLQPASSQARYELALVARRNCAPPC